MPATAWDLFCSAWFSVFSHWLTANSSFSHRFCWWLGWQCLVVLLCSARFISSVRLLRASAFLWLAMWPALRYRGPSQCAPEVNRDGAQNLGERAPSIRVWWGCGQQIPRARNKALGMTRFLRGRGAGVTFVIAAGCYGVAAAGFCSASHCFWDFDYCFDSDTFADHGDRRGVSRPACRRNDARGVSTL